MNVVLIGFMGTGKSAVGRVLAKWLGWPFYDVDEMIEKETGLAIADIFSQNGEASFRDLECRAVARVGALNRAVIATGGGVPLQEDNMRELERNGLVFCLSARPETVLKRLQKEMHVRPLLKGKDPVRTVEELLRVRQKNYARCRHTIETDEWTVEQAAEKIMSLIPKPT